MLIKKDLLYELLEKEFEVFKDKVISSFDNDKELSTRDTTFEAAYTFYMTNKFKDFLNKDRVFFARKVDRYLEKAKDCTYFFKNVTKNIIRFKKTFTYEEALKIIEVYKNKAKNNFYGALLKKDNTFINPLHILTCLDYKENKIYYTKEIKYNIASDKELKYELILYFYNDLPGVYSEYYGKRFDDTNEEDLNNFITSNLKNIIKAYKLKTHYNKKLISCYHSNTNKEIILPNSIEIDYILTNKGEPVNEISYIISNQVITNGIAAPYYGTSLVNIKENNASGTFLSPMASCNISSPIEAYYNTVNLTTVCTGNLSNTSIKGLRTLSHCNLSSAYSKYILYYGFIEYAKAMAELSLSLYKRK